MRCTGPKPEQRKGTKIMSQFNEATDSLKENPHRSTGHHAPNNRPEVLSPEHREPRLLDSFTAECSALRQIIRAGDVEKFGNLKRNVDPEHFQDPNTRTIAEVLWQQYEAGAAIDSLTIGAELKKANQTGAFDSLFDLMMAPEREPDFRDCVHTVLNWKRAAQSTLSAGQYQTFTFKDMARLPRQQWLIRKLLVEKTASILSADSGSFKSFIALEMALCIALGVPFHGFEVKQGAAVYIAPEGFYTLLDRATAWAQHHDCELPENFHILKVPVNVSDPAIVAAFAAQIESHSPALVVLDTLSQCAIGLNENANNEMALFVGGMMALGHRIGAHVMALHHNSKGTGAFRGAGAIKANADAHISMDRPEGDETNTVFVRCEKQRGRDFEPFALRGREVELPYVDEFGDAITSLVFELCGDAVTPKSEKHPNAKRADKTRAALMEVFDQSAIDGADYGGVKVGFWKEKVEETEPLICEERTFWKYRKALEDDGTIEQCGSHNNSPLFRRKTPVSLSTATTATTAKCSECSHANKCSAKYCNNCNNPLGVAVGAVPTAVAENCSDELPEMPEQQTPKPKSSKSESEPYATTTAREKVKL
jgi:hypothetical protein